MCVQETCLTSKPVFNLPGYDLFQRDLVNKGHLYIYKTGTQKGCANATIAFEYNVIEILMQKKFIYGVAMFIIHLK